MSPKAPTTEEAMILSLDTTRGWLQKRLEEIRKDSRLLKLLATITEKSPQVLSTAIRQGNWRIHQSNGDWGVVLLTKHHWVTYPFVHLRDIMESGALERRAASKASWAARQQLTQDVNRLRCFNNASESWGKVTKGRKAAAQAELARKVKELTSTAL